MVYSILIEYTLKVGMTFLRQRNYNYIIILLLWLIGVKLYICSVISNLTIKGYGHQSN